MPDFAPPAALRLEPVGRLSPAEVSAVTAVVDQATEADGVRPLSEHVMLHLRYGGDDAGRNVLAYAGDQLVAYGHLDTSDAIAGASAEVVVHPGHRRRGYGRAVVEAMTGEAQGRRLRLWAHGEHPAAAALAARTGFSRSRVLWQMRRSLYAALPPAQVPAEVVVRTFQPGRDDAEWVRLNASVFASHPEQGQWTVEDLHVRMREPWFDPEGFFLAERGGRLVGFHWTKIHGGGDQHHGHRALGEVYVIGVDPAEHGKGLGRALTLIGLQHLRQKGLPDAMLYVEADNRSALRLYTALGFTRWDTDVMFSRDSPPDEPAGDARAGDYSTSADTT